MKAILTSAGFDNDRLVPVFLNLFDRPVESAKALFIPTALNTPDAREYVHVFLEDLYKVGIIDSNIDEYDLDKPFDSRRIIDYDVVFTCAGDSQYLLNRVNKVNFGIALESFFNNNGVYIGVSAGSDIMALNLPENLGYLNATIKCHAREGHEIGPLDTSSVPLVKLTDNQAILINGDIIEVVE